MAAMLDGELHVLALADNESEDALVSASKTLVLGLGGKELAVVEEIVLQAFRV